MDVRNVVEELTQACMEVRRTLDSLQDDRKERETLVLRHVETYANKNVRINDFQAGLEWFNVAEGLSTTRHLSGKIIILDFFTYCCINCMHVLPDLDALEKKFSIEDGVVVVGVHSAKFSNERDSMKLFSAVQRYNITHPVVNDTTLSVWHDLGITCWPTLVMIGPELQPLAVFVGEGHRNELLLYTDVALTYFKSLKRISDRSLPTQPWRHLTSRANGTLFFPGKLECFQSKHGERLVVSDTGNNRILVVDTEGNVEFAVGGCNPGFEDGSFGNSKFNAPQGVCILGNKIFVADTENHAIRKIDLTKGIVTTIAGTGFQGHDYVGGKIGKDQVLSSPWDLAVYQHDSGKTVVPVLLIAMAGTHQIWCFFLEDTLWWKNSIQKSGTCAAIVGSGREENRNNTYPHAAGLAQPSGLAVSQESKIAFFADSESSTIRRIDLQNGRVSAVCGANRNPTDLHDFGDADGTQFAAKLQHPLGVTCHPSAEIIYVADTYNHKIKRIDPAGTCKTVYGAGRPNEKFSFDEPSGIAVSANGKMLYIADTNNHVVKVIDLANDTISTLAVQISKETSTTWDNRYTFSTTIDAKGGELNIRFSVSFENDLKLNPNSPQKWFVDLPTDSWSAEAITGKLSTPVSVRVSEGKGTKQLRVTLDLITCTSTECIPRRLSVIYDVFQCSNAPATVTEERLLTIKQ